MKTEIFKVYQVAHKKLLSGTFVLNKGRVDRKFGRKNKLCNNGLFLINRQTCGAIVVSAGF